MSNINEGESGSMKGILKDRGEAKMDNGKILIVDDQFGIRLLLNEVFKKEGYQTYQAENGQIALKLAGMHLPDLVVLDIKIPGMDGIEILKRMKEIDPSIHVIIMTAYGDLKMIHKAKELGALTHIAKPFDIEELAKTVKEILSDKILEKI